MKAERFTAWIFIFVMMGFMVLAPISLAVKQVNKMAVKENNIDWGKLYPFADADKIPNSASTKESTYEYFKSIYGHLKHIRRTLKEYDFMIGYYEIVETAKRYENIVNWNMAPVADYNAVIKLKDGYFSSYKMSGDVKTDAALVTDFAGFCAGKGIDFIYINFPAKICKLEDSEISGVLDFSNQNADRFLSLLKEAGVKCYNFNDMLHKHTMKHHEAFFVTDHHWKPETGLWAASCILKVLRDDLGWPVKPEVLSRENFEYTIYPEWFLGSQGKKLTLMRAKPDDFTLIYPKFDTHLKFEIPSAGINLEGNFSIMYNMKEIEPKRYYKTNPYGAYFYGIKPLSRVENKLVRNRKRLLVIYDSFSDCVIPFMSLEIQNIDAIYLNQFTGSVRKFIEIEKPDAVVVAYNSAVPGRTSKHLLLPTYNKQYDFR